MPAINPVFRYDCSDRTGDTSFFDAIVGTGTVTSDTGQSFTGPRSIKLTTSAGSGQVTATKNNVLSDAGRRLVMRIRVSALPGAIAAFFRIGNGAGTTLCDYGLNNAGQLVIRNANGTVLGTGTTVNAINTWFQVRFSYVFTSNLVWQIKAGVGSALEIDLNSPTALTAGVGSNRFTLIAGSGFGASQSVWVDDAWLDDGTDLGYVGNVRVGPRVLAA